MVAPFCLKEEQKDIEGNGAIWEECVLDGPENSYLSHEEVLKTCSLGFSPISSNSRAWSSEIRGVEAWQLN